METATSHISLLSVMLVLQNFSLAQHKDWEQLATLPYCDCLLRVMPELEHFNVA